MEFNSLGKIYAYQWTFHHIKTKVLHNPLRIFFYLLIYSILTFSSAEGKYIATRQRSYNSSHTMPRGIFGDLEERERGKRKRLLFRETTTS